ncbi:MAG TPA: outer membrane protein assembly factor BamD, partial [Polyangiaceae bacterium]|nr:outer membrane protein assembly factor BamD [Polyangiaceae bacterium]
LRLSTNPRPDEAASSATPRADRATDSVDATAEQDHAAAMLRESEGVAAARTQLSQGNASAALETLAKLDRDVPRGVLGQERALYAILALQANGQRELAARRAEAFLATYPNSPHADRVRELTHR